MEEKRKPRSFSGKREAEGRGTEGRRQKAEGGRGEGKKEEGKRGEGRRGERGERPPQRATRRGDFESRPKTRTEGNFEKTEGGREERKKFFTERKERSFTDRKERKFTDQKERSFTDRKKDKPERKWEKNEEKRDFSERKERKFTDRKTEPTERRGRRFSDTENESTERRGRKFSDTRTENPERSPRTSGRKPQTGDRKPFVSDRKSFDSDRPVRKRRRDVTAESEILTEIVELRRREGRTSPKKQKILSLEHEEKYGPIRLNKYISNSGICSRRDADMLIETGAIQVNGVIVTELGTKIMPTDEVRFGDRILQREKPVYLLLNKPKDYITTVEDERDRKHVMQLIKGACKERVYPVGRLDKNTTGLLLFTNDGEMTKKLTHPKHGIRKIYYVELNKNLTAADFNKIAEGIELSDGEIKVDEIAYAGETKREIGITLHSGRNRIVRRIFEQLGYEVEKLDRVVFAGLTKKDLPRGTYRFLSDAEVNILKMIK
jgi:23S rRNA pseudouridine2605 synthase